MTIAHMLRNHVTSVARGSDQERGPTITAALDDGPLQGIRIEPRVVEGRPPSTDDVPAEDGSGIDAGVHGPARDRDALRAPRRPD